MDDPDAIWKPGYDGPPPIVPASPAGGQSTVRTDPAKPSRSRRRFVVGVTLGLVLVAAVVVLDPLGSRDETATDDAVSDEPPRSAIGPPDPSVFGGAAARRIPQGATNLWSVDIQDVGDHWVEVIGRDLVIAAIAGPVGSPSSASAPVTTLVALDAATGAQRWTLQLPADLRDVKVIGAVDDVLVLEQPGVNGSTVTGVDVMTGETRWSADAAPNDGHVGLVGTRFIARLPSPPDRFVSLIDATSGRDVGTIASDPTAPGRPGGWSTDRRGTWYVIDDGEVVRYDLESDVGEATVVGPVADVSMPGVVVGVVVGDRFAVVDGAGSITFEEAGERSPVTVSADVPASVRSMTPVSDANFVVTTPESIAGMSVDGDLVNLTVNLTWSRGEGAVVDEHAVEGGTLLQVATSGGAGMQLVDGLTGETVEHLTMMPGALNALVVAGDGFVALRTSDFGAKLAGIDLDGTERWSIAGSTPVVVGDRIVVRATSDEVVDGNSGRTSRLLRITAYGDAE